GRGGLRRLRLEGVHPPQGRQCRDHEDPDGRLPCPDRAFAALLPGQGRPAEGGWHGHDGGGLPSDPCCCGRGLTIPGSVDSGAAIPIIARFSGASGTSYGRASARRKSLKELKLWLV